jgi:hypothetical protein
MLPISRRGINPMGVRRKGYNKKKTGLVTTQFYTDVPLSTLTKLDRIAEVEGKSKTETFTQLIREAYADYVVDSQFNAGDEMAEQAEFVKQYMLQHFGESPADPEMAQSEALEAFWKEKGLKLAPDDDAFHLPKFN